MTSRADDDPPMDPGDWKQRFESLQLTHERTEKRLLKTLRIADKYQADLRDLSDRLAESTAKVRALQEAVLPVCMHCKRVRVENESWSSLDGFLFDRADIVFSHGICPTCLDARYGSLLKPTPNPPPPGSAAAPTSDATTSRFDELLSRDTTSDDPWRPRLEELLAQYRKLLRRFGKVTLMSDAYQLEIRETSLRLEHAARTDKLTGLFERRAMIELLSIEIGRARSSESPATVVLARVRGLRRLNTKHGLAVGDAVLLRVAKRLNAASTPERTCSRWGNAEFLVLSPPNLHHDVDAWLASLRAMLAEVTVDVAGLPLRVSVGIGTAPVEPGSTLDDILGRAHLALGTG